MKGNKKLTIEIAPQIHEGITKTLHHGQLTQLIRAFFSELYIKFRSGQRKQVMDWLYDGKPLTFDPVTFNEDNDDDD